MGFYSHAKEWERENSKEVRQEARGWQFTDETHLEIQFFLHIVPWKW